MASFFLFCSWDIAAFHLRPFPSWFRFPCDLVELFVYLLKQIYISREKLVIVVDCEGRKQQKQTLTNDTRSHTMTLYFPINMTAEQTFSNILTDRHVPHSTVRAVWRNVTPHRYCASLIYQSFVIVVMAVSSNLRLTPKNLRHIYWNGNTVTAYSPVYARSTDGLHFLMFLFKTYVYKMNLKLTPLVAKPVWIFENITSNLLVVYTLRHMSMQN
jgi:hypothetical protein